MRRREGELSATWNSYSARRELNVQVIAGTVPVHRRREGRRDTGDELCTEPEAGEAACVSHTYLSLHGPHSRLHACMQPMLVAALQSPDVIFNFETRRSGLTQL